MPFQPIANYAGYNHILSTGSHWTHPTNGNTYACVCEQRKGAQQNLVVYRMSPGAPQWELVKRFLGTVDSSGHITIGGASIEPDGSLLVTTSLIIPGAQQVTATGFQGCWIRVANVDTPYTPDATQPQPQLQSGAITLLPQPNPNVYSNRLVTTAGELVDIAATFGVPVATGYLVRLSGLASLPNVKVRIGTQVAPYFVTLVTQVANVRVDTQGWIPSPQAWISTVDGSAQVWLQVIGYT